MGEIRPVPQEEIMGQFVGIFYKVIEPAFNRRDFDFARIVISDLCLRQAALERIPEGMTGGLYTSALVQLVAYCDLRRAPSS